MADAKGAALAARASGAGGLVGRWLMRATVPLARRASRRRLSAGRPRSLWGVTPIVTLAVKAKADRCLGFRSDTLVFTTYYITRAFDLNLRYVLSIARRCGTSVLRLTETAILCWAALRYDVVHYFFDRGLLPPDGMSGIRRDELEFLRDCGTRVYGFAYGADVRTRNRTLALGRWNFCVDCETPGRYCRCDDDAGTRDLREISDRLTAAIALGDMLAYLPSARSLHYWPIDLGALPATVPPAPNAGEPLRIVHAPNHTHFKGSGYLEATVEALRAEGHPIEYSKVQGVPNHEVLRLFASADVVADQFIGGAYGYAALEAMALGRPVLTYVRSPDLVEAHEECPLIQATPDTLRDVLLWALVNREKLRAIGSQGRRYVERWHSIEAVAARLAGLYRDTGDFPTILTSRWEAFQRTEDARIARHPPARDWRHPFPVGGSAVEEAASEGQGR